MFNLDGMKNLENLIKTYNDFPKKGIAFKDILGIIQDTEVFGELMLVARKPGKLPGELVEENYDLEYGKNTLSIQKDSIKKFSSYAIVDDLLATGGTVDCVAKLIKKSGKEICGLVTVVELMELNGRHRFNFPVESMLSL